MTRPERRTRPRRGFVLLAALTIVALGVSVPAASAVEQEPDHVVLEWNLHTINALSNTSTSTPPGAGQPPQVASLHLAMVQIAVFDALNAIDGSYEGYLANLPTAPPTASRAAAVATAAHDVLVGLSPALPQAVRDSVHALYLASLAEIPDGDAEDQGKAIGAAAAAAMLADRTGDGRYGPHRFTARFGIGQWRPELPGFVSDPNAWLAEVRPFALKRPSQLRTEGPLDLASAQYAAEFNEVKALGALNGSSRTPEQTALARFVTANPVPMLYEGLRTVAQRRGLSTMEVARLFAMTSTASADAMISCWNDKDHWSFWRPITAIREAANDGNPATEPADWAPLFATPPYPDHPSGYNCMTGAMMYSARLFFGTDRIAFALYSPASGATREYRRFTDVIDDTIDGRIYTGFHFRTPDVQGAWIGKKAAQWVARHYFEPVD